MLCVCSSGAAQWSGAEPELETRRIPAGFFLQGNDNYKKKKSKLKKVVIYLFIYLKGTVSVFHFRNKS